MDPEHAATGCVESVQNKAVSNRSKKRSKGKSTGRAPSAGEVEKINWRVQSEGKGLDLSWSAAGRRRWERGGAGDGYGDARAARCRRREGGGEKEEDGPHGAGAELGCCVGGGEEEGGGGGGAGDGDGREEERWVGGGEESRGGRDGGGKEEAGFGRRWEGVESWDVHQAVQNFLADVDE